MTDAIWLEDEATWPAPLVDFLERHADVFRRWEQRHTRKGSGHVEAWEYDDAVRGLRAALTPYLLHGYHCTRLTDGEIERIISEGMQLPNGERLRERLSTLRAAGFLDEAVEARLLAANQANDRNRAGMIWFCFFEPRIAGKSGIERLFRSWGGEALYNSHERDASTGPLLRGIGTPCLVEADVPIASLEVHSFLDDKVARRFLVNRGLKTREPVDHEDRAKQPIPATCIRRIIRFPEPDFMQLTGCTYWDPPLGEFG